MSLFKVKIEYEDELEAKDTEEAYNKFWESQMTGNTDLLSFVDANTIIKELCPHCGTELEDKMIDVDGTNLQEHTVCEKCGYGYPALY